MTTMTERPQGLEERNARPDVPKKAGHRGRAFVCRLALVLTLAGCKGGGSEDGNSVTPCTAIIFGQSLQTPAAGDVYLRAINASCTTLDMGVLVANLSGIWTVGFDLKYPASILQYQSFAPGPLLNKDNPPVPAGFFVTTPSSGTIVVSATRFSPDPSLSAVGSELLITLHFVKVASGSGSLDFDTSLSSLVSDEILDDAGNIVASSFGPGHGGSVLVP